MVNMSNFETAKAPSTYYEILDISPGLLDDHHNSGQVLKRAYRSALLKHHPDKALCVQFSKTSCGFTVDQISEAFAVLSDTKQRAEYDRALKLTSRGDGSSLKGTAQFRTGVEDVDLDDLRFDSDKQLWCRSCRCGNPRGYLFSEQDLAEATDSEELMIGCQDCSLWLRVHFAVLDEIEEADEAAPGGQREGG
jgi:DnaJ-class molecular chaperone